MTDYHPPITDMRFVLEHISNLPDIAAFPGYEDASPDMVGAILDEAARLATHVIAPLNWTGDQQGATLRDDGMVKTADGFKEAYQQYAQGGWNGVPFSKDYGGMGLPWCLTMAINEMWQGANLSFGLCPLLNQGAIDALEHHGSQAQKDTYLAKMISGEWTGTMNLTEPQAGTDLAQIKTSARKEGDHWRLKGTKIFITYGDHDYTDNIIHMVLSRTDGAPEGVKGLSLFIVPKILDDGSVNDLKCVSLEHKLGIHGSPTAVMAYGDHEGAVAYLIGEEGKGLNYMFTMMNNARISVGLQGVAVSDRAYQHALSYARERVQSPRLDEKGGAGVPIIEHPDVKRMLLSMRAGTEATRALTYYAAAQLDIAARHPDEAERAKGAALSDLLTPLVKSFGTDMACDITSTGVQIHGGMGFVEETGAAQYYRDARILPIYEGTNGIQANDLMFRKVLRDQGAVAKALIAKMAAFHCDTTAKGPVEALSRSTDWILSTAASDINAVAAGAVPYQRLFSIVVGGYMMARLAVAAEKELEAGTGNAEFLKTKILTAQFYADHYLTECEGLAKTVMDGSGSVTAITSGQF